MRLDGFGLLVSDMGTMIRFYRDVLGFEIREAEDSSNVYLVKDGTLFLLYGRKDFEKMTGHRYEYIRGLNGHFEIALYVDSFEEVDTAFRKAVENGAQPVLEPTTEPLEPGWATLEPGFVPALESGADPLESGASAELWLPLDCGTVALEAGAAALLTRISPVSGSFVALAGHFWRASRSAVIKSSPSWKILAVEPSMTK